MPGGAGHRGGTGHSRRPAPARIATGRDDSLAAMEISQVAVVGLGTMGAGIAEVFARAGLGVVAIEADPAALGHGLSLIERSLDRAVSRGRLAPAERDAIGARIAPAAGFGEATGADLAIEAVPERPDIKRQVFAELDAVLPPHAILATNTSSLSVTAIAAATSRPGRVVGMHFFNPAPAMALVEVVSTVLAADGVTAAVAALARRLGKTPVQVGDRAGFVANALLLPYLNHAARLLETGFASREDIDAAATAGLGLPMGPLALLDLIGLDTSLSIMEVLAAEFGGSRYVPAPLLRRLVDAGRTGRKSGRGLYDYAAPAPDSPGSRNDGAAPRPASVTLIVPGADGDSELADAVAAAGITVNTDPAAGSDLVLVETALAEPVLAVALATGRPRDTVGLHRAGGLAELVVTGLASPAAAATAAALARALGWPVVLLYPHVADAVRMVQDGYASAADVDTAMTLGCGYRRGPLQMLDEAGPATVLSVLAAMHQAYGDPAFAPPPLLADYAAAGLRFRG
jgi:3-hydroxybutyryl-CoA dehydrogenase